MAEIWYPNTTAINYGIDPSTSDHTVVSQIGVRYENMFPQYVAIYLQIDRENNTSIDFDTQGQLEVEGQWEDNQRTRIVILENPLQQVPRVGGANWYVVVRGSEYLHLSVDPSPIGFESQSQNQFPLDGTNILRAVHFYWTND